MEMAEGFEDGLSDTAEDDKLGRNGGGCLMMWLGL